MPALRVNGRRLLARLDELAQVGAIPGTRGCSRLALSDADRFGRDLVVTWMRDLGLDVRLDVIGNVVATMAGYEPGARPVMTGSHIDTVATGAAATATPACSPVSRWWSGRSRRASTCPVPSPSPSSPTRRAPGSPPTCSARWPTSAACPPPSAPRPEA